MSARAEFPEGSDEVLAALLREVKTKAEFQRVQAVWLRVTLELSDDRLRKRSGYRPTPCAVWVPAFGVRAPRLWRVRVAAADDTKT